MFFLMHISCIQNFIDNTCYNFFCKKKFFKIKIYKILIEINYITKILSGLFILEIEKQMLTKPKSKNLINNFTSQRRMNFK